MGSSTQGPHGLGRAPLGKSKSVLPDLLESEESESPEMIAQRHVDSEPIDEERSDERTSSDSIDAALIRSMVGYTAPRAYSRCSTMRADPAVP
jgi:hypothetical protein|eukprot:5252545-Prymnesium_polylepis.3